MTFYASVFCGVFVGRDICTTDAPRTATAATRAASTLAWVSTVEMPSMRPHICSNLQETSFHPVQIGIRDPREPGITEISYKNIL